MLPEVRSSSEVYGERLDACSASRACRSPASPATSRRRSSARLCCEPGMAKNTYGTGCFMLQNTGDQRRRLAATSCSRPSPGSCERPDRIRARRQRVHRRRRRAVAPRRPRHDPHPSAEIEPLAATRARQRRRLPRAGVRRPGRAALGSVRARHDRRHHARHDGRPHRPGGAREHRLPGRRSARRDAGRLRHSR